MVWHEHGPDLSSLPSEYAKDPRLADKMLLLGLAKHDPTAPEAIAFLEVKGMPCPAARGELLGASSQGGTWFRCRCEWAMLILTQETIWRSVLIEKAARGSRGSTRREAIGCLADLEPTPESLGAIEEAASAPSFKVRWSACLALLSWTGARPPVGPQFDQTLRAMFPLRRVAARRADRERWRTVAEKLAAEVRATLPERPYSFVPPRWR
jgi:hypothetical protein